jgi:hypothetical protein
VRNTVTNGEVLIAVYGGVPSKHEEVGGAGAALRRVDPGESEGVGNGLERAADRRSADGEQLDRGRPGRHVDHPEGGELRAHVVGYPEGHVRAAFMVGAGRHDLAIVGDRAALHLRVVAHPRHLAADDLETVLAVAVQVAADRGIEGDRSLPARAQPRARYLRWRRSNCCCT